MSIEEAVVLQSMKMLRKKKINLALHDHGIKKYFQEKNDQILTKHNSYIFLLSQEFVKVVYDSNLLSVCANTEIEYVSQEIVRMHFFLAIVKIFSVM